MKKKRICCRNFEQNEESVITFAKESHFFFVFCTNFLRFFIRCLLYYVTNRTKKGENLNG